MSARVVCLVALLAACAWLLPAGQGFVGQADAAPRTAVSLSATKPDALPYGERAPLPKGYGIRTGLSDLLKPLNSEYGVTAKEDSIPTYIVMLTGMLKDAGPSSLPPSHARPQRSTMSARVVCFVALLAACAWLLPAGQGFVGQVDAAPRTVVGLSATKPDALPYGERAPLPKGYGIRTGLSDLLKPLNSEYGVTAKEDSIPTYIVMLTGIVLLVLLAAAPHQQPVGAPPPEDEFDEYVANFLPYFFFGDK
eukprot:CAMPEP_0171145136 /NCGR_PEP_ID=MMETSP0766_2-20121228/146908_1 /TAXON_ID=439317 /ORGANISM="Gambierdiscus australes, Strain CAWD 149" /LENGTH=250 /DNA_ID=CAMNT_0011609035 /DNA_START=76 /DNA_END=829 /DNA_ORIENTATION=-